MNAFDRYVTVKEKAVFCSMNKMETVEARDLC